MGAIAIILCVLSVACFLIAIGLHIAGKAYRKVIEKEAEEEENEKTSNP